MLRIEDLMQLLAAICLCLRAQNPQCRVLCHQPVLRSLRDG